MKKTAKLLSLFVAIALSAGALSACKPADSNTTSSGATDSSKDTSSSAGADLSTVTNELTMKVEGELDDSKTLTTIINVDSSPAFNGNPFDETAGLSWSVQPFLYDTLAYFSPYPERTFKNSLMESYTYEGNVLTIKILPGQKWSDGTALDAQDVLVNYYCTVGKNQIWNYLETLEKVDDLTLKLTFTKDSPLILNLAFKTPIRTNDEKYQAFSDQYAEVVKTGREKDSATNTYKFTADGTEKSSAILNKMLEEKPKPNEAISCGPYIIDKYNTSEVLFKVNPNFRKEPTIKSIRGLRPGDSQAFPTALLAGEYTIEDGGLNVDMSKQIDQKYNDTMRKVFVPQMSQIGYAMNTQKYPLDKVEVRRAISLATDRDALISIAEPGSFPGNKQNSGLIPSLIEPYVGSEYANSLTDYSFNPDEAAKQLESIGWKKEGDKWVDDKGESPVITIGTINSWPSFMMTGEAMSQMLTDFGFNIEFKPMEFGVWNDFTKGQDKMVYCTFIGAAASYAHPWESFNDLFNVNPRAGWQTFKAGEDKIFTSPVDNKEYNVTNMLDELYSTNDEAKTVELTKELMKLANELCGYVSIIDKAGPVRIYDPKLSMPEAKVGELQQSYYYYGNVNDMMIRMLLDDAIYFVK